MKRLFTHIGTLAGIVPAGVRRKEGAAMDRVETLSDAWLLVDEGRIAAFGDAASPLPSGADETIDCEGGLLMPAFCDSHTHIVYAGCRDGEFLDKIRGLSYEEIAANGGGILNSADLLHKTSEDELFRQSMERVGEMIAQGTGAIEIKSGYGLNPVDELKMLRVIDRIKSSSPALIKATFLGAHAVGRGYTHDDYVEAVCRMMPEAARYADFVDIFCEKGFFSVEDAARVLEAGLRAGLRPKIHANQLAVSGGVQVGVRYGALSVDHLEQSGEAEIAALHDSVTMPTMLPGSSFFLRIPDGPAKDYIAAGLGLALASDYNPGSSPSGDMRFIWALGCIRMRLTPAQAFNAVTLNSAYAMGVSDQCGSITVGKRANLILTRPGWNLTKIPYLHHTPYIRQVYLQGKAI
ncbi:MAG: imidazolonepropionase [Bacteroidales bacterium]|jgi:imidazolonepropionase|nr:imidazolonepropionase [Bacteroidales bacterium]